MITALLQTGHEVMIPLVLNGMSRFTEWIIAFCVKRVRCVLDRLMVVFGRPIRWYLMGLLAAESVRSWVQDLVIFIIIRKRIRKIMRTK